MSYFSTALSRLAARNGLKQADFVRGARLTRSYLSRVFNGEQRYVADDDVIALLQMFPNAGDRAELIAARCMDARIGPGADLVEISVRSAPPIQATPQHIELSPDAERAFAWLRAQCPLNPDLEKHLVGYARLTGMK